MGMACGGGGTPGDDTGKTDVISKTDVIGDAEDELPGDATEDGFRDAEGDATGDTLGDIGPDDKPDFPRQCFIDDDCDDEDDCTTDVCTATGTCANYTVICEDNDPCTEDACVQGEGCVFTEIPNCTPDCELDGDCDDQDVCTTDSCDDGHCSFIAIVCDDLDECTTNSCDPVDGCMFVAIPGCEPNLCEQDIDCDDSNFCTTDSCVEDRCIYSAVVCDDSDPCTINSCIASVGCVFTPDPACAPCLGDLDCNDGNRCTLDRCVEGECVSSPISCNDGDPCTVDSCDPATGCRYVAIPGCVAECDSDSDCDDENACTTDSCDLDEVPPVCVFAPVSSGTVCNDGNLCTANDACDDGFCTGGFANCDDGNPCTTDFCDPASGCVHVQIPDCSHCVTNEDCNDADVCTVDRCTNGDCNYRPVSCNDNNPCTTDRCVVGPTGNAACSYSPNPGAACNDNNPCTVTDICVSNKCVGSGALECDDDNVCTIDSCDPAVGCVHKPVSCNDNNSCTTDVCVVGPTGAPACSYTPRNGQPCDNGNLCTVNDVCSGTTCIAGGPRDCNDGDGCTIDHCDSGVGCVHGPFVCNDNNTCTEDRCESLPDGGRRCIFAALDLVPCNDNNVCTVNEICRNGVCQGTQINCDDGVRCTRDTCDPVQGCQHAIDPNCACNGRADCNDGNPGTCDCCCDFGTGRRCYNLVVPGGTCSCALMPGCN
jgi:hypothetical protein